ncbi:DUF4962 domain-containing protein [Bacteroidota bacterium]
MRIRKRHIVPVLRITALLISQTILLCSNNAMEEDHQFPAEQPKNGNFNRPAQGEILDVSPPGFCWWRAGDMSEVFYRVHIYSSDHNEIHASSLLDEPAYVPAEVLAPGKYSWSVDAVDSDGKILATRAESGFEISTGAVELPWIDPAELLKRVPPSHPRLLFPEDQLTGIRDNLDKLYKDPWTNLQESAARALEMPLVKEPSFDTIIGRKNYAAKRTAYRIEYHAVGNTYLGGVVPMALTYLLNGETKYGEAVKAHLLHLCDWELDGALSVQDPKFDEVGLRLARALPQAYDWTHDLFTAEERLRMENWMAALADNFLARMNKRDFLFYSGESHDGRVPGYLMEFAIVLADRPEAATWMDYGMKAALTVWPHWAGSDGGWAEGVDYALQYNERFITPLQSVWTATGYNLWQKPFFRKFPYFLTYCISPIGELTPFGDSENQPASNRADKLKSMLLYYSHVNGDAGLRWWVDELSAGAAEAVETDEAPVDELSAVRSLLVPDTIQPVMPSSLPPDRAFHGVGWTAFHTDLSNPENDLMLLFKSSAFGPASHSHADQNSFAIMKGGKALAIPAGERYPQHGSPFHTKYSRLTEAHNTLLFNGMGQKDKDAQANGRIIDFRSLPHIGYAAGEAHNAYGPPVRKFVRHSLLIRPSIILVVDEVETDEPASIDWLLHSKEKFNISEEVQRLSANRTGEIMQIDLLSQEGFEFSQSDEWPVDPKEGYPMVKTESPEKQWHFKGRLRQQVTKTVIAALMSIDTGIGNSHLNTIRQKDGKEIKISAIFEGGDTAEILVNLDTDLPGAESQLIKITYTPKEGDMEKLIIQSINNY